MSGAGAGGAGAMGAGGGAGAGLPAGPGLGDGVASLQGPELAKQASHVAQGLGFLIEQFKQKPKIQSILRSWLLQVQELECVFLEDLFLERWLDTAVGAQLDTLGAIVGEPRGGRLDDEYRVAISTKVLINNSRGTQEELIAVTGRTLKPLDPASLDIEIEEFYPAAIEIRVLEEALGFDPTDAFKLIKLAVAAGIEAFLIFRIDADTFQFASGSTPEIDAAIGFADETQTTGGHLAGVIS